MYLVDLFFISRKYNIEKASAISVQSIRWCFWIERRSSELDTRDLLKKNDEGGLVARLAENSPKAMRCDGIFGTAPPNLHTQPNRTLCCNK